MAIEYIFTSKEILEKDDLYDMQETAWNGYIIKYQLTSEELKWLDFIKGKYSISDYILDNLERENILTIDAYEMTKALLKDNQGSGKAVMLSDDSALQRIFFWLYNSED